MLKHLDLYLTTEYCKSNPLVLLFFQVIYMARNAKDNLVSYFHFDRMNFTQPEPGPWDGYIHKFMKGQCKTNYIFKCYPQNNNNNYYNLITLKSFQTCVTDFFIWQTISKYFDKFFNCFCQRNVNIFNPLTLIVWTKSETVFHV